MSRRHHRPWRFLALPSVVAGALVGVLVIGVPAAEARQTIDRELSLKSVGEQSAVGQLKARPPCRDRQKVLIDFAFGRSVNAWTDESGEFRFKVRRISRLNRVVLSVERHVMHRKGGGSVVCSKAELNTGIPPACPNPPACPRFPRSDADGKKQGPTPVKRSKAFQ